jgi:hypothetical protein
MIKRRLMLRASLLAVNNGAARKLVFLAALLYYVIGAFAQAQPIPFFRSLYSFTNGADGGGPFPGANLIASGNTLYGTASARAQMATAPCSP